MRFASLLRATAAVVSPEYGGVWSAGSLVSLKIGCELFGYARRG